MYVKLHNSGGLGLGTSRNVSGVSNASLQQHCDSTFTFREAAWPSG